MYSKCSRHCEGDSSLYFLSGWDSCKPNLQSSGCQPRKWANDGGLWETGQWCEFKQLLKSQLSIIFTCQTSSDLCLLSTFSCWSGSAGPSPGCRIEPKRRLSAICRQNRRTSEITAVSTNHQRFAVTLVMLSPFKHLESVYSQLPSSNF